MNILTPLSTLFLVSVHLCKQGHVLSANTILALLYCCLIKSECAQVLAEVFDIVSFTSCSCSCSKEEYIIHYNVIGVTLSRACVHCYEIMTILLLLTNQCRLCKHKNVFAYCVATQKSSAELHVSLNQLFLSIVNQLFLSIVNQLFLSLVNQLFLSLVNQLFLSLVNQ